MTEANNIPAPLTLKVWGLEPFTLTATFSGLTLDALGGDWTLEILNRRHDRQSRYSIESDQDGQVVTSTVSAEQTTALLGNTSRWAGFFKLRNSVAPRTFVAGDLIVTTDPEDLGASTGTGVAVTVSNATVTVTVSAVGTASDIAVTDDFPLATGDDTIAEAVARIGPMAADITRVAAARRARKDYARLVKDGTAFHIGLVGDSVTTGYNATTTGGYTWAEILRSRLKQLCGLPAGTHGHRPATTLGYLSPRATVVAGSALNGIGFGMNACVLSYGDSVTFTVTDVSKIMVNYNRQNISTQSYLEISDSVDGVITGSGLDGYDSGAGGFPGTNYTVWTSSALTPAASRVLTFRCKTDATKQSGVTFNAVQFLHEAEGSGDLVFWNGGKFGAVTNDFLAQNLSSVYMNVDLLGSSGVDAGLVLIATGLNETSASTYQTKLESLVTQIRAHCTSNAGPSFILCTPWAKTGRATSSNADYVQAVYDAAATVGGWVLPCHEVLGDGSLNYLSLLDADGIHPTDIGHRVLGLWMAERVAEFIGAPATSLDTDIDGGTP